MRRKERLPELLAPAGSFEALVAAASAGADAVYVGGKSFGARAYAKNFDDEELRRAAVYCRLHAVKLYVTVNVLVYDRELPALCDYARLLRDIGVDAVIMTDLGAIAAFRAVAPELEIHASTQMGIHNALGAEAAFRLGCKRAVLARELPLCDINAITDSAPLETEIFLHGALCVSHSGQCLMSALVGGRSGNRGECAQPCRLPYNGKYPLSLSDLSLASHVVELIASGVASLKIEGRMKSPDYVYSVTRIYRHLLDEGRNALPEEAAELARIFSRGGFTDGYFTGRIAEKMTGVRSESDKKDTESSERHSFAPEKMKLTARAELALGKPSRLTLTLAGRSVTAVGDVPSPALRAPLTEPEVRARLAKMGNTFFSLDAADVELSLDEGINLAPSAINLLRRKAVAMLEGGGDAREREVEAELPRRPTRRQRGLSTALFFNPAAIPEEAEKYFSIIFVPLDKFLAAPRFAKGVYMPPVITERELPEVRAMLSEARRRGATYALVGNLAHPSLAREAGLIPIGDYRLNVSNSYALAEYEAMGVDGAILSAELGLPMVRDVGGGTIVYGRIPLMLTERCFAKENFGCSKCGKAAFTDRTGARFPVIREYGHRNIILNSAVTYMGDKRRELDEMNVGIRHFIFTTETRAEARRAMEAFQSGAALGTAAVRRVGRRR